MFFWFSKGSIKELCFLVFSVFGYLKILKVLDFCFFLGKEAEQFWSFPCSLLVVSAFVQCMLQHQLEAKLLKDAEKGQHEAEAMLWICVFVLGGCRTVLELPLQLACSFGDQADKLQCFSLQML